MVQFDLTGPIGYIQSFDKLQSALGERKRGDVVEIEAALGDKSVRLFMEAEGLYIIGFRGDGNRAFVLDGENQAFDEYIKAHLKLARDNAALTKLPTFARYESGTWGLLFSKTELMKAKELSSFAGGNQSIKHHIDRLAFAISESLRFKPIRCAVACELRGDDDFRPVLFKLAEWSGRFHENERNVAPPPKTAEDPPLSKEDARLRERLGAGSIHVVAIRQNTFSKFGIVDRLLEVLGGKTILSDEDRQRLKSYRGAGGAFTLRHFEKLMKNWRTLSLIDDPNVRGIMGVLHNEIRQITNSSSINVAEWH